MKFAYLVPSVLTAGTIALAASVTPASAITLTTGGAPAIDGSNLTTAVPGATVVNFNSGFPATPTYTGGAVVGPGSLAGSYAAPLGDTTKYYSVGPSTSEPGTIINFGAALTYFGLYWGSIDTYNTIEFFSGNTSLGLFNGGNVSGAPANGSQTDPNNNLYVNFSAGPGESFDKIVLRSSGINAFESDNHAYTAIPEPLTMLGVGTAIGFGGYFKRALAKKQKKDKTKA